MAGSSEFCLKQEWWFIFSFHDVHMVWQGILKANLTAWVPGHTLSEKDIV